MDSSRSCSGKLKKLSLKNLKNNFSTRSHQQEDETVPNDSTTYNSDSETEPTFTTKKTFSIFKSLKKKCKGTLSSCKSKQKPIGSKSTVSQLVTVRMPSFLAILQATNEDISIPPPVPPRVPPPDDSSTDVMCSGRGVQEELSTLIRFGWYWGSITRANVEEKLKDQPDGAFLVRDSSSNNYILSLSFRSNGRTFHTRIEHSVGNYTFYNQQQGFPSIAELVEASMNISKSSVLCYSAQRHDNFFPESLGYPVRLTKPVSRFTEVRNLNHLCRFVIRQYVSVNHISSLPLPVTLKEYLRQDYW